MLVVNGHNQRSTERGLPRTDAEPSKIPSCMHVYAAVYFKGRCEY